MSRKFRGRLHFQYQQSSKMHRVIELKLLVNLVLFLRHKIGYGFIFLLVLLNNLGGVILTLILWIL